MSLSDEDSSMMDALGKTQFEDLCLQSSLQEVFQFQTQHVIEFHFAFIQHTNSDKTSQQSITWKEDTTTQYFNSVDQYSFLFIDKVKM